MGKGCPDMSFEEIMEEIKLGLTGEVEKDVIYIMQKNKEYKKSAFAEEIGRETGKMIYNILPDEEKVIFERLLMEDTETIVKKIKSIESEVKECNYMKAVEIAETIIPNIQSDGKSDGNFDYICLSNLFELYLYTKIYKKGSQVKPTPFNFSYVFRLYGFALFKLSKDNEAEKAYENAVFWNPIGIDALLDLGEIKFLKKKYKSFLEIIKKCLDYSYDINQTALCYYNLGRYYFEKENYELAINMYILSHYFKPNKASYQKIQNLVSEKGIELKPPSTDDMKKICNSIGVRMGINPLVVNLAASMGTEAKKHGNIEAAKYFYDILFSLTGDKAILDIVFDYMKQIKDKK